MQEALQNTHKHAHATSVHVEWEKSGAEWVLRCRDDGVGFDIVRAARQHRSVGLLSMRERAELIGAQFDLRSMPVAVQIVTYVLPARYFVALLQTIFLAGDIWIVILPIAAVLAVMVLVQFKRGDGGFQFVSQHSWISEFGISWKLGVDGISLFLVLLTALLFPLAIIGPKVHRDVKSYICWMLVLEAGCLGTFLSLDLFLFFLFFGLLRFAFWGPRRWAYYGHHGYGYSGRENEAYHILRERYARGEITKDQYDAMMRDLYQQPPQQTPPRY